MKIIPEDSIVFVAENNKAIIICPKCKKFKHESVEKYRNEKHFLKIRCSCGHFFEIKLNFRKGIRKKSNLEGTYRKISNQKSSINECRIVNLSYQGLCIKTFSENSLDVGDMIVINFQLDNKQMTPVERKIEVVNLFQEDHVGGVFVDHETDDFNKDIAFYMMH
jgi:hypothetical protein